MIQGCASLRRLLVFFSLCTISLSYAQTLPPAALKVIHTFVAADGNTPVGNLVQGSDGTLYGVLLGGGTFQQGSVFKIDATGQFQTIYSFGSTSQPINAPAGAYPATGLSVGPDGNLYGTTSQGGPNYGGTLFKLSVTGQLATLVAFGGPAPAGTAPAAPLFLGSDGSFYGTTNSGGAFGGGTVFRMTPSGALTSLHDFAGDGSEGEGLYGALFAAADGSVYGTTSTGGLHDSAGDGTVFAIAADGTFSTLHYFPYTATNAFSGLTVGADGTFYALSAFGGAGSGEVFSITTDGFFTVLHQFGCSCGTPDGSEPTGSLTLASDGNFYGVTSFGGTSNRGTIYRMAPTGVVTPLHSFAGSDGDSPVGGVIQGADGRFYGMTSGEFTHTATVYGLALPPAAAPAQLTTTATDGAVTLNWNATATTNSYSVYQGTSAGGEGATPVLTGITATSATVKSLRDGTTYYFQVVAANEAGDGPASAEASAMPIAMPSNLSATAANGSVSLSWTSAAGATSYSVYEGNASGAEATGAIASGITATSFSVTGLTNGRPYYFKVASVDGATMVESASEATATPVAPATPSSPSGGGGAMDAVGLFALALLALYVRGFGRPTITNGRVTQGVRAVVAPTSAALMLGLAGCGGGDGGSAPVPQFTIGGAVSGIPAGTSLILKDNGGDSITVNSNSGFTFATPIATGGSYAVTIATQIPGQTCTVGNGSGTVNGANVAAVTIACTPALYTIGGTVSGLAPGTSLVLNDNGGDPTTIATNAAFTFPTPVTAGKAYAVTVATQPVHQTCVVSGGSGTAATSNVTSVSIACAPTTYTISGVVTGLGGGTAIVLQNDGKDSVTLNTNTRFTFATALPAAAAYSVTITSQPAYQYCTVVAGSGTVTDAAITNVIVHCPYAETLWDFGYGLDGKIPRAGLIVGKDGNLYGTTAYGGPLLWGSVYQITPGGNETVLASFAAGTDASEPQAALVQGVDGNLYGTTYAGGANNAGTVFRVTPDGVATIVWSFGAGTDGQGPVAALIQGTDGNFYGTTASGGANNFGTAFRVTPSGMETVLWNFGAGTDGQSPMAALVQANDGNLYGTTALGGAHGAGTAFRLDLAGNETVLWNFDQTTGAEPQSPLIQATDGNLYGTAAGGGANNAGTIFRITLLGATSVFYSFSGGTDAGFPQSGIIQARDGNFYGTSSVGGTAPGCGSGGAVGACGTIFEVTPAGVETVLWDFGFGGDGAAASPVSLVQGADGNFYGVTSGEGATASGTVFKLTP